MNKILERQGYHLFAWVVLGSILYCATLQHESRHNPGEWGLSAFEWIAVSWILAGLSQGWVAFFWRLELHGGKISARMGSAGFVVHRIGYLTLFAGRLASLIPISVATSHTMSIPLWASIPLWVITLPPTAWAIYSAVFYFGLARASGADHFDPAYRSRTFEKRGIYKYIDNSMYSVALLALYHPGIFYESPLGLMTAAAHHAFVWVHYFCTEKPDLSEIYGGNGVPSVGRVS